ncbi:olfactory receptor 10A7-like [Hyperolius riggenbachi]|uniref:olfactory receptor 10A7-like n=1 Tax=Hyperolius riggenbachi TaxID=752182 RepID=UPI0035A2D489
MGLSPLPQDNTVPKELIAGVLVPQRQGRQWWLEKVPDSKLSENESSWICTFYKCISKHFQVTVSEDVVNGMTLKDGQHKLHEICLEPILYIVILNGNLLIIVLVASLDHLQIPMFIFLQHLATADLLLTTTVVPLMLNIILVDEKRIPFCGLNIIDHFFCDFGPTVELATSETTFLLQVDFAISVLMVFFPFAFTVITYITIMIIIMNISTNNGRSKAFSTCSSHLATVCAYYGTLMTVSLNSVKETSSTNNKLSSILYIVVTPLLNPIIYSLSNQQIKRTLQKVVHHFRVFGEKEIRTRRNSF